MQNIHYGHSTFKTADAIAKAVLEYAETLASRRRFAVIDIPTVTPAGVVSAQLLIGPGIPIAAALRLDETAAGDDVARDEFGGGTAAGAIGDLDVHRTVRTLTDGMERVRARISTTPLGGDALVDDLPEQGRL